MLNRRQHVAVLAACAIAFLVSLLVGQQPSAAEAAQKKGKEPGAASTKQMLAETKAPAGFNVTIYAQPPQVNYPVCLVAAPTGEVFIGIDENSSLDKKLGRGRIVRCRDTKGDGVADEILDFAKVDSPRGLFWDNGKLYVMAPPDLSVFYDEEGTGKAQRHEVLVKGIGRDLAFRGADHTTNGMQLGIDGWFYIAVGDYGFAKGQGKDGGPVEMYGGGIARVRSDGTGLEIFSMGQRNIVDVAIDPFMNIFTRDNTNDGGGWDVRLSHVVHGGNFGYPKLFVNFPEDHIKPLADYGGGAPTGALFIDEPTLPAPFNNNLFTVDWGKSNIYIHNPKPAGATFKVEQKSFLQIPRPTDMSIDPAGRIYVSSWRGASYNYIGPNVGYIARLTPKDFKATPFPDLKKAKVEELLKLVGSDSHTTRQYAQREIIRRGYQEDTCKALEGLAGNVNAKNLAARVAALFTLQQLGKEKATDALLRLAKDDLLRPFALRALADNPAKAANVPTDLFVSALSDANPRTRLEAVTALGRLGRKEAIAKMLPFAGDKDDVLAHIAIKNLADLRAWEPPLNAMQPGTPSRMLLGCSQILQYQHDPVVVDAVLAKLDTATDAEVRKYLLRSLTRLYHKEAPWDGKSWWNTRPDTKGPYYKPVTWAASTKISQGIQTALTKSDKIVLTSLVNELRRNRINLDIVPLVLKLAATDVSFRPTAVDFLLSRPKLAANELKWLEEVAVSPKDAPATRAKVLLGLHNLSPKTASLLPTIAAGFSTVTDKSPPELLQAREEFLRDIRNGQNVAFWSKQTKAKEAEQKELAYAVLLTLTMNLQAPPKQRDEATRAIDSAWASADNTVSLLRAIGWSNADHYGLQVKEKQKDTREEVKVAANYAAKLLDLDAQINRTGPIIAKLAYDEIVAAVAKEKGDAKLGSRLFFKQGCVTCHTVSSQEAPRGPLLADITTRYKKDEIMESILKPSAKIAQGFETQYFVLTDGKTLEGFVTRESGTEVEIRTLTGIATIIQKSDIDQRSRRETSMMPEGLVQNLTIQELASIWAYLDTLKGKAK
ncbi:MAG TPA: HEAT repeat domain-containing protein [Gemmataceae bacterium]|nr:HEAT repeat domain-containing protein [Gemmataceae bacterium]